MSDSSETSNNAITIHISDSSDKRKAKLLKKAEPKQNKYKRKLEGMDDEEQKNFHATSNK